MNLLLAFSASHRARLLGHREPVMRIAVWVKDVFPVLRERLGKEEEWGRDEVVMANIMLASLEIISPGTFEVPGISWQNHLQMARQMIIRRGGLHPVPRAGSPFHGDAREEKDEKVARFMMRWFAYLDVLGSLSGNKNDTPLSAAYFTTPPGDDDLQIDCLLGFTGRCISILARIAGLAKICEEQRIDEQGNVREDWRLEDPDIRIQANSLLRELEEGLGMRMQYKGCQCSSNRSQSPGFGSTFDEAESGWDAVEIYATNEMFHWAGLIHLYRRVLGRKREDPGVQNAVREIVALLYKVRRGSTAEACLLFPMFTAGCDALDLGQREKIVERLRVVEEFGMTQVSFTEIFIFY